MSGRAITPDPSGIQTVLTSLANSKDGYDFKITCGDASWDVHKFVLSTHSPVLHAACTKDFKEAAEATLDLSDDPVKCVGALTFYLYNLNYDCRELTAQDNVLGYHVSMCILADKYDIQPLKKLAEEKFKDKLTQGPDDDDLEMAALTVYKIRGPTARIREHIANFIVESDARLRVLRFDCEYEWLIRMNADLATDVFLASRAHFDHIPEKGERRYKCPNGGCGKTLVVELPTDDSHLFCCFWCYYRFGTAEWRKGLVERRYGCGY